MKQINDQSQMDAIPNSSRFFTSILLRYFLFILVWISPPEEDKLDTISSTAKNTLNRAVVMF